MPRRPAPASLARRIGARIRALRLEAGITQEHLAWDCELDKGFVSQIESGKRMPSVPVLFQLADRLGVYASDLLAVEPRAARHALSEAARRGNVRAVHEALKRLGLLPTRREQS